MKLAIKGAAVLTAMMLMATAANAQLLNESVTGFGGSINATADGANAKATDKSATNVVTIVYDNSTSPTLFGLSSTDLAARWGDELFTTSTGILSSHQFSIFNSGSSLGPLLTANIGVDFFDAPSSTFLGGYTTSINFGTGLAPGFFSTVTVSPLDPLLIGITSTDIIVIQRVVSKTGAASRLGIVSKSPATVGSSPSSMYVQATTIGGGVPGFYTFANGAADPVHQIGLNPPPVGTKNSTWGQLKKLYR